MRTPLCTVLAPFDEAGSARFEILKRIGEDLGFRTFRVEAYYSSGLITEEIVRAIRDADLLMADLTGANFNVYYETGIAHALGKRVFLLSEDPDSVRGDFGNSPVCVFESSDKGVEKLRGEVEEFARIPGCLSPITLFTGGSSVAGQRLVVRRFMAFFVDFAIMLVLGALLMLSLSFASGLLRGFEAGILALGFVGYFFVSTMLLGASLGQRLLSLEVIQLNRNRPSVGQSLMRPVASVLNVMSLGISLFWMAKPGRYQAVHDTLTRTLVVKKDSWGAEFSCTDARNERGRSSLSG